MTATHRSGVRPRVVVVGGGPTGVETAGALAEMRNKDRPVVYPEFDPSRVHVTLVEMGPALPAAFRPGSRNYAARALRRCRNWHSPPCRVAGTRRPRSGPTSSARGSGRSGTRPSSY